MARSETAVVDASVVAKWFLQEKHTEKALEIRDAHVAGHLHLVAPVLMIYEVANALRYHPHVGSALLQACMRDLLEVQIGLDTVSEESMAAAIGRAYETGLTIYDACYVSLADRLDCPLITADEVQLAVAGSHGQDLRRWSRER